METSRLHNVTVGYCYYLLVLFTTMLAPSSLALAQNNPIGPTVAQQQWSDLKFGLFVHFGINTYYDTEWSDGSLDQNRFNPTELDTDQWCKAAKAAGMRYIVIVAKHHDGFCNWPSKYTHYTVAHTPFKKDLLLAVVTSAKKFGLKVGFYYSLWDRHEKTHDTDEWAYVNFMKNQLHELLTHYGPITEIWFDGFWVKQQSGWTKQDGTPGAHVHTESSSRNKDFIEAWRMEGAYRWQMDHLYQYIKSLQPDCLVMNNSTTAYPGVPLHPVDIRSGERATELGEDQKIWTFKNREIYLPLQIETTMSAKGQENFPNGNWFWHPSDHSVTTDEKIRAWVVSASDLNANLLINVGPMANGKLRPEDEKVLLRLNLK